MYEEGQTKRPTDLFSSKEFKRTAVISVVPPPDFNNRVQWKNNSLDALAKHLGGRRKKRRKLNDSGEETSNEATDYRTYTRSVTVPSILNRLRQEINSLVGTRQRFKKPRLPGPLPVTMDRERLEMLNSKREDYWVCEKTDGERFMLYFNQKGDAYFVNRKFEFWRLEDEFYGSFLGGTVTLLDGELVESMGKLVYYSYDCVHSMNSSMKDLHLSHRLKAIGNIVSIFREKVADWPKPPPIEIKGKLFLKSTHAQTILSKIKMENGHYIYRDIDASTGVVKRENKNDGIIFTPEMQPYIPRDKSALFKWKWLEKNSIDLIAYFPFLEGQAGNEVQLFCQAQGRHTALWSKVTLPSKHLQKMHELLQEARAKNGHLQEIIFECAWDFKEKIWFPQMLRLDKQKPNYSTVCTATLLTLVDEIRPVEL